MHNTKNKGEVRLKMEDKDNGFFAHIVEIDRYTEVTLKIPKRLDAIELKALCAKATKLFNMAEVVVNPNIQRKIYAPKAKLSLQEKKDYIIEFERAKRDGTIDDLAKEKGLTPYQYKQKAYQMKYDVRKRHGVNINAWVKLMLKGDEK